MIDNWKFFNGYAVAHGVSLKRLDVGDLVDYVWHLATRNMEQHEIDRFEATVWLPPPNTEIPKESPWSPESEMAAFASLKAQLS